MLTNCRLRSVRQRGERYEVKYETDGRAETSEAEFILNAAGRIPSIGDLALGHGNVERNKNGIVVSEFPRSISNKHVFAAGDAHGRMLSPIADYEGRIAARKFLEGDVERVN